MGGNPFSHENPVPKSKASPEKPKEDPDVLVHRKSGMAFKRGTSDLVSPSKPKTVYNSPSEFKKFKQDLQSRKKYESDSDCELEITTNVKKTLKVKYKDKVTVLDTEIFGPKALDKLGFNPFKKDVVYQTVGLGLNKKKVAEESSDLELEIEKN
jgi:hypothetical protein